MVTGLTKLREYFEAYSGQYIIIGGTACDMVLSGLGLKARATKDIDIILVVEALNANFVRQFWKFIRDGNYEKKEKGEEQRKYYRFTKPENLDFPYQIELFSRNPDLLDLNEGTHLTPIPAQDELSSLSAILLDESYYSFVRDHCLVQDGLLRAQTEALICLKAKAWIDISNRLTEGRKEDSKKLSKHKGDIFRLAGTLAGTDSFDLPVTLKVDLQSFVDAIEHELPGDGVFKEMGLSTSNAEIVFNQLKVCFKLY